MTISFRALRSVVLATALLAGAAMTRGAALPQVELKLMSEGFTALMAWVPLPDGGFLAVDQPGLIHFVNADGRTAPEPVADLRDRMVAVKLNYDERGLLDLVLHPRFADNRKAYVIYNKPLRAGAPANWDSTLVLSELRLTASTPPKGDLSSERVLLEIDKPYGNHNGGRLAFGPDGFLYAGIGDGGGGNDQGRRPAEGNGQHLRTHLGKVLRIDVDRGEPFAIPSDNPFAEGKDGLPEIYAYGFRNPWGLTFDRGGGRDLFLADVGQNLFEEVNIVVRGGNYGWNLREGFEPFDPKKARSVPETGVRVGARGEPLLDPILDYPHRLPETAAPQGISITGGYVYRGKAIPGLEGRYVFADWSRIMGVPDGRLMVATRPTGGATRWSVAYLPVKGAPEGKLGLFITAFGQDNDGELYVLTSARSNPAGKEARAWRLMPAEK